MDVPGLCAQCGQPGILRTCPLCGSLVCNRCETEGLHAHGAGGRGRLRPPHGAR